MERKCTDEKDKRQRRQEGKKSKSYFIECVQTDEVDVTECER